MFSSSRILIAGGVAAVLALSFASSAEAFWGRHHRHGCCQPVVVSHGCCGDPCGGAYAGGYGGPVETSFSGGGGYYDAGYPGGYYDSPGVGVGIGYPGGYGPGYSGGWGGRGAYGPGYPGGGWGRGPGVGIRF